jgi:hypothetical protein
VIEKRYKRRVQLRVFLAQGHGCRAAKLPPNGLDISGGALIDWYWCRTDSNLQKS